MCVRDTRKANLRFDFLYILQHIIHSDRSLQLSAFGVAPGLGLITNYSSSLEFVLPHILVLWTGQRRTMKCSLGKTTKPLCQPGRPTLWTEELLPRSTPRTQPQDNSSRVQPWTIVSWHVRAGVGGVVDDAVAMVEVDASAVQAGGLWGQLHCDEWLTTPSSKAWNHEESSEDDRS